MSQSEGNIATQAPRLRFARFSPSLPGRSLGLYIELEAPRGGVHVAPTDGDGVLGPTPPPLPASRTQGDPKGGKGGTQQQQGQPWRNGRWSHEELQFLDVLRQDFEDGALDSSVEAGTTFRLYASHKLQCDPMRVSKRFTHDKKIGLLKYQPKANLSAAELDARSKRRESAEMRFWIMVHEKAKQRNAAAEGGGHRKKRARGLGSGLMHSPHQGACTTAGMLLPLLSSAAVGEARRGGYGEEDGEGLGPEERLLSLPHHGMLLMSCTASRVVLDEVVEDFARFRGSVDNLPPELSSRLEGVVGKTSALLQDMAPWKAHDLALATLTPTPLLHHTRPGMGGGGGGVGGSGPGALPGGVTSSSASSSSASSDDNHGDGDGPPHSPSMTGGAPGRGLGQGGHHHAGHHHLGGIHHHHMRGPGEEEDEEEGEEGEEEPDEEDYEHAQLLLHQAHPQRHAPPPDPSRGHHHPYHLPQPPPQYALPHEAYRGRGGGPSPDDEMPCPPSAPTHDHHPEGVEPSPFYSTYPLSAPLPPLCGPPSPPSLPSTPLPSPSTQAPQATAAPPQHYPYPAAAPSLAPPVNGGHREVEEHKDQGGAPYHHQHQLPHTDAHYPRRLPPPPPPPPPLHPVAATAPAN